MIAEYIGQKVYHVKSGKLFVLRKSLLGTYDLYNNRKIIKYNEEKWRRDLDSGRIVFEEDYIKIKPGDNFKATINEHFLDILVIKHRHTFLLVDKRNYRSFKVMEFDEINKEFITIKDVRRGIESSSYKFQFVSLEKCQ